MKLKVLNFLQDVAVKVLTIQDFHDDQFKEFLREVCLADLIVRYKYNDLRYFSYAEYFVIRQSCGIHSGIKSHLSMDHNALTSLSII